VKASLKLLYFVEGFTDIRFVEGLSQIADLTLAVPRRAFEESGLDVRMARMGLPVRVVQISGGRWLWQIRSAVFLWKNIRSFDVVLVQELLRGAWNAGWIGRLRGVPVVATFLLEPREYFRCRYRRRQIGPIRAWMGDMILAFLLHSNGRLVRTCLALGTYLQEAARRYGARVRPGYYYGVDVTLYRPKAGGEAREALRRRWGIGPEDFLIFFPSRISHEKDPATVLEAVRLLRQRGRRAVVLNLSGGFEAFTQWAQRLGLPEESFRAGPAAHPVDELPDYYRAADVVVQASLAEGLGLAPLEALLCGTPVVATAVGGLAQNLRGKARLVPPQDALKMANELEDIWQDRVKAQQQTLAVRDEIVREWNRERAFTELAKDLAQAIRVKS
jgi:glycosyltransferase involved in cell wall biosynthesis